MIPKSEEKMEEYPDTPAWTMFFDGPLYQKYDEFMKNKDFSKILLNTKLKLANSQGPEVVSSTHSIEYDHWDKEQDTDPTEHTYPYVSEDFYRKVKEDQRRRTRKTRAFILLGLVIMAALAFGTALVIHYFFIPPLEERNPKNFVNVSFSVNTTSSNVSDIEQTTAAGDLTNLLETLPKDPHHTHGHKHEHILNPDGGKIFDDQFISTTTVPTKGSVDISTTTTEMTAQTTMTKLPVKTPSMSSKTAVYLLHLKPKTPDTDTGHESATISQKHSTTAQINHMDFFGMDESHSTTFSFDSTGSYGDFFTYDDLTTTTEAQTAPKLGADKTTHAATSKSTSAGSTTFQSATTTKAQLPKAATKPKTDTTSHATTSQITSAENTTVQVTTTAEEHLTQLTTTPEAHTTAHAATNKSISPESITLETTLGSQLGQNQTVTTLKKESLTQTDQTTPTFRTSSTIAIHNDTTTEKILTTTSVSSITLPTSTLTPNVTKIATNAAVEETTSARLTTSVSKTSSPEAVTTMSDILSETNSTNDGNNTVIMRDVTSYTFETAVLECIVKHAIRWQSLSIRINQTWRPLEVTLYPDGEIKWSRSKTRRNDVSFDIKNSTDGTGSNMTLGLIINDVQCRDANSYFCTLNSEVIDRVARGRLIVLGKPSQKITLTFGPSIIENKALRITASWQGGYPEPWTNMTWTAIDSNNNSYNLAKYGDYRDYELHADHHFCQTTLEHSIVVFPPIHLNDTTVIVKPNLKGKKFFVDETREKYLQNVEPGIDKILVIPLNYCKNAKKEMKIPHPYTACKKFLRCLPGDMVVQQCPIGTCFYEKAQECA